MTLSPGTRLGPYEIQAAIGAGGMGEVYKAKDTRLDRTVAIKVLPAHVSADPDRRARFAREAKTIAGLNNPHICALFDVGDATPTGPQSLAPVPAAVSYLVMEHLTGETLAQRLEKGPLPMDQALSVAAEIADALSAAHRQGVIHRDLKPGNVMLTKAGAKLLDFGLAKLKGHGEQPAAESLDSAPTRTTPLTSEGTIIGTLQYMAPEQVEGKPADARTDLWALGAILYQMLTGKPAFEGSSAAGLIGAILEREPAPLHTLQPLTPPSVDRLVRQCLAKLPDDRPDTAHDVAGELRWIREPAGAPSQTQARHQRGTWVAWSIALAALLLAAVSTTIAALVWLRSSSPHLPDGPVHLLLSDLGPASVAEGQRSFAVSRDGQRVAFVAERDGIRRLYVRDLQTIEPTVIPGTENAKEPFFSPDGERIGFFADGRVKVTSLAGGTPAVLADVTSDDRGASWAPDDTIVFCPSSGAGLWQVPAAGGSPRVLAQPDPDRKERSYRWPEVLPGGEAVVFTLATSDIQSFDDARLMLRSLRTGEQRELLRGGSFATYSATGHLVFARAGALMAAPFDPARQVITGPARPVVDGFVTYPFSGAAQYALAGNGTLVYIAGRPISQQATLTWIDRTGKTSVLAAPPAAYQGVSIAPDGRSAALAIDGANSSVWLFDLDRMSSTRVTLEWSSGAPFWTPDGARITFRSAGAGVRRLFWQPADSGASPEPLTPASLSLVNTGSWAPDGRTLVFDNLRAESGWDVWVLVVGGDSTAKPFLQTSFNERNPRFSPDGRWIAYESDETGRPEVYVRPYPASGRKFRISTDGGTLAVWARDGSELFYRNGSSVMGAAIRTSPSFSAARPQLLFQRKESQYLYDVARDGRFLMAEDLPLPALGPLTVVLNWDSELRRRLTAAR